MILQARFAKDVKFFKPGFLQRWNLQDYSNVDAACIFVGVYHPEDVMAINRHNGLKVVLLTNSILPDFLQQLNPNHLVFVTGNNMNHINLGTFKTKQVNIALKDYQAFQPTLLGNKIYCYMGNELRKFDYGFGLARQIQDEIRLEIVFGMINKKAPETLTTEYLKQTYYNDCFVNLQLSSHGGRITMLELAHMGRMSITNAPDPWCLEYRSVEDIPRLINQESEKIGTIQPCLIPKNYFVGEEWKQENFWL